MPALSIGPTKKNPGANAPGFLFIEGANYYCFAGGPESSP
jgi:hypothetical protein